MAGSSGVDVPGELPGVVGERSSQVGEVPEWVGAGEGRFVADGDSSTVVRRAISAVLHGRAETYQFVWAALELTERGPRQDAVNRRAWS